MSQKKTRDYAAFYLNGELTRVSGDDALMMLAEWLRKRALKTGTKIVCAEGDCGACTVLRAYQLNNSSGKLAFASMNSCIATVAQMDGSHLVTVEGLEYEGDLAPAQKAMRECHGSQCGYCTPGFVMVLTGALEVKNSLDRKTAANYMTGNLCRCTGYSPILDAAERAKASPKHNLAKRYLGITKIKNLREETKTSFELKGSVGRNFFAPSSIKDACKFLAKHKDAKLVAATTDLGVQTNKGKPLPLNLLSLQKIPELYDIKASKSSLRVGARVSLSRLRIATAKSIPEFSRFLDLFASPQIKNVATLVGNLANASPIGDTLPFLLASDSVVHTSKFSAGKIISRKVPMSEFFLGYKKLALKPGELITGVEIPLTSQTKAVRLFKTSQRKDLDISAVSAALAVEQKKTGEITNASLAFGGIAATPVRLTKVEDFLLGKKPTRDLIDSASKILGDDIHPISDVRGTSGFRRVLADQIFHQYMHEVVMDKANSQ
jgi:xanthine dehydrogenase small subunit